MNHWIICSALHCQRTRAKILTNRSFAVSLFFFVFVSQFKNNPPTTIVSWHCVYFKKHCRLCHIVMHLCFFFWICSMRWNLPTTALSWSIYILQWHLFVKISSLHPFPAQHESTHGLFLDIFVFISLLGFALFVSFFVLTLLLCKLVTFSIRLYLRGCVLCYFFNK